MFSKAVINKIFKSVFSTLIVLIIGVQPIPAQEDIPETGLASTSLSSVGQITVPAYDMGWYRETGSHVPTNLSYFVGWGTGLGGYHNFFVFDLSSITSTVYAVKLRAYNPVNGYQSSDSSEIWTLFDVDTAIPTLLSGTGGAGAYNDLGSGSSFGEVYVTSADDDTYIEVTFNSTGVTEIESARGGDFAIGGALTEIDSLGDQFMFSDSGISPKVELVLYTTTPCDEVHRNPINNCSFENDYTSWTLVDQAPSTLDGTWGIATDGQLIKSAETTFDYADIVFVDQFSPGLPHTYRSSNGSQLAYFLRNSYGYYRLYQDVSLAYAGDLCWEMEYNNHLGVHDPVDQYLAVNIRDLNNTILTTLFKTTDGVDPLILSPMTRYCFDISAYSNMTVRLDVELYPDDDNFDAAFDNFSIEVNHPPVLDPIGDQSILENRQFSFTATASDADLSDTLTFSLVGPAGASIDPGSGQFTWTPTEAQGPGIYPATIYVKDDGIPSLDGDKETFHITVNDVIFLPISTK